MLIDWLDQEQKSFELPYDRNANFNLLDTNMYFVSDDFRSNMEVSATTGGFKGCGLSYNSDSNTVTATKCDLYVAYMYWFKIGECDSCLPAIWEKF